MAEAREWTNFNLAEEATLIGGQDILSSCEPIDGFATGRNYCSTWGWISKTRYCLCVMSVWQKCLEISKLGTRYLFMYLAFSIYPVDSVPKNCFCISLSYQLTGCESANKEVSAACDGTYLSESEGPRSCLRDNCLSAVSPQQKLQECSDEIIVVPTSSCHHHELRHCQTTECTGDNAQIIVQDYNTWVCANSCHATATCDISLSATLF